MYVHVQAMSRWHRTLIMVTLIATVAAIAGLANPASAGSSGEQAYLVTVENLTENQTITPAVVASHERSFEVFRRNHVASNGLQQLAENGGVPVLVDELSATPEVASVGVAGDVPIAPGESASTVVTTFPDTRRISVAAMLICTNDGFAGVSSVQPSADGTTVNTYGRAYDAGTEINTQDFDDLVPPCSGIPGTGTGMSDPALAEFGSVHFHGGIADRGDLSDAAHGWQDPTIKVTIEPVATYEITITNLTTGQPVTPGVFAAHVGAYSMFSHGVAASNGLQQLAENGGVPVLASEAAANADVTGSGVIGAEPIGPGGSADGSIEIVGNATRFSIAAMLVCTNDGFGGLDGVMLPRDVGETLNYQAEAYDAGTEINTESFDDLVPPCDGDLETGTGVSNPALAEGGTVHPHAGIAEIADLTEAHDWDGPVIAVSVERIG